MEIQKRLILNKTPKDMPYGSIPCAKNMMIDDTGSFLTNDIGFDTSFYGREGEKIVGVIPCDSEIVIFTYIEEYDEEIDNEIIHHPAESTIYRKPDNIKITSTNRNVYKVNCNWQWHKGTLCGSYTYNYKGELIIALGEYNSPIDDYKHIPLKSWNLDSASLKQTYNIEEDIPKYASSYIVGRNGNLVCGVYTFFIRFKIDEYNFTKWFQITSDINIIQEASSKKYNHYYVYLGLNEGTTFEDHVVADDFYINNNEISNKNITISLSFPDYVLNNFSFDKVQLGYIIKRNSDVSGRIQGEYTIQSIQEGEHKISIVNNNFIEEVSVDELLENPHQFFNVKNIINYNNRLYIANYEEYALEDLTVFSKNNTTIAIDTENNERTIRRSVRTAFVSGQKVSFRVWQEGHRSGSPHKENILPDIEFTVDENGYTTVGNYQTVLQHLTKILVFMDGGFTTDWTNTGISELYLFIQKDDGQYQRDSALCLAKTDLNGEAHSYWGWNFGPNNEQYPYINEQDFKVKITGNTKDDLDVVIEYNGYTWSLLGKNGEHICLLYYNRDRNFDTKDFIIGNGMYSSTMEGALDPPVQFPNDIQLGVNRVGNEDDEPEDPESGGESKAAGANTRTLHPFQKYNFFIHYIRKDGSCTQGFQFLLDYNSYNVVSDKTIIVPKFTAQNPNPDIYVGYFITYEDVESTVDCMYLTCVDSSSTNPKIFFTNAKYLYDIDTIRGKKINIDGTSYTIEDIDYVENKLTFNHIKGVLALEESISIDDDQIAYWLKDVENIYNNKTKILYRLCRNIYTFGEEVKDYDYLPAFYGTQTIVLYTANGANNPKELILDPASQFVTTFVDSGDPRTQYDIHIKTPAMYSQYPMEAMNIKEDFQQASVVLTTDDGQSGAKDKFRVNTLVSPDKLHDLLELKAAYTAKPSKSFTNYNEDNIFTFNKTIYRSDVISDESLENGFRHFDINNYKNILENKGKIVNIIGIGLYLIVHTEYSIFVFDRTPKLTAKSQLDIPDVFDIDYQDVMPSNEGFGGLLEKEESILTKHGYIWYDHNNKIIFNYENGKVTILSADINNFVKNLNVSSVRFAEDITNSRLIICFYTNDYDASYRQVITLSYSFNTSSFVSIHDYKFTHNYRTAKKSYVFDSTKPGNLYEFSNEYIVNYRELFNPQSFYFPYYASPTNATYSARSYVDIIFNKDYFVSKVVNSIKYILSKIVNNRYPYKITEEQLERHFSGNELKIYTDEVDSGEIDISVDENEINKNEDYKHPYYEKGVWNLSYFRNRINELTHSDDMSLIYGKYIVVRFIFNNNVKVKFEGIDIQTNLY